MTKTNPTILILDNPHRIFGFEILFTGTIDSASIYPREVVKRTLQLNAKALILAHNHPSGTPEPSEADRQITRKLIDGKRPINSVCIPKSKGVKIVST